MSVLLTAFGMLGQFDWYTWIAMFWLMLILEVPRYGLGALTVLAMSFRRKKPLGTRESARLATMKISVVVAGHNEASAIWKCLRSLGEQTRRPDEIIVVDDGSTDGMREVLAELRRAKLIDISLCNQVRCGKPAACNLGINLSRGDIIINLDADCSYDRDAIERLIEPFADPQVGATTGAIAARNFDRSAVTAWQALEYLLSISLGKRVADMLGLVMCASGAFGAFRRAAVEQVGVMVPGPGEDLDMTMRLRRSGWKIRFVGEAWCFTDVPETFAALSRQRRRWDRDTLRLRLRKFRDTFHPFRRNFSLLETFEQLEFVVLNLLVTVLFPAYLVFLALFLGTGALYVIVFVAMIYFFSDTMAFLVALKVSNRYPARMIWTIAPYLLTYGLFNGGLMRLVRLYAYYEEWVLRASRRDSYSPSRISRQALHY